MTVRERLEHAILLGEDDRSEAELHALGAMHVATFNAKSPDKTTPGEDRALVLPIDEHMFILAIADGCGGMPGGATAAHTAIQNLSSTILAESPNDPDSLCAAALAGFGRANEEVLAMGIGAGTTLVALIVAPGHARIIHVGDSPALITGQRGKLRFEAIAHSPTGFAVEAGLMTELEAVHHEHRSVVLNIVGSRDMRVDIGPPVALRPRDTVLLGSDGLTDNLFVGEIIECVRAGPLDRCVQTLAERAMDRMIGADPDHPGHADDLTIIACRAAN